VTFIIYSKYTQQCQPLLLMEPGQPSHAPAHPPGRQHLLLPGLSAPFLTLTLQHERSEGIPTAKSGLTPACFTSPGGTNLLPRSASCTWLPDAEHPSVLSHHAQGLALPVTLLSCLFPGTSSTQLPQPFALTILSPCPQPSSA
jgi:hypothetical protein